MAVAAAAGYQYLGFPNTQTVETQTYLKKRLQTLAVVYTQNFYFNSITRGFSCCLSLQLLNTLGLGRINNLLAGVSALRPCPGESPVRPRGPPRWLTPSDPRSALERSRLPRETSAGTGMGGDKGGAGRVAAEEDDVAGREAEAEGEGQAGGEVEGQSEGEACSGNLTIPLEKAEDVWWRRILADPQAAAMPPHVVGLSGAGAGAGGAAGAAATSAAAARGVSTPARAAAAVAPARPTPGTRRAPGTAAGVPSPAIPGLGAAPSPYDVDASLVDSTRPVADYDADTQSAIRRIMYEQVSELCA